jgi:hypothetical protein
MPLPQQRVPHWKSGHKIGASAKGVWIFALFNIPRIAKP